MNKWNIMLVESNGDHRNDALGRLGAEPSWDVTAVMNAEEAISLLYRQPVDVLVLGSMDETEERKLRRVAAYHQPELLMVTLTQEDLAERVAHAIALLETGKRPAFRFVDDALKHAGIPVMVQ
jgi:hypothetical protein